MNKTWGDTVRELLACKTPEEAQSWLSKEIQERARQYNMTVEKAEHDLRFSISYMMGYYDDETAARMQKLLHLTHPILPWVGRTPITEERQQEAFQKGLQQVKKEKQQ